MIPVLKGERVILRGFTWADFPAFGAMWNDSALTKFIPFAPVALPESWARLNGNSYRWVRCGFGNWAVVDHDGVFLGTTDFFNSPASGSEDQDETGIMSGWVFAKAARGCGIASEAVSLNHDWLDAQSVGSVTYCGMDVRHAASIRVAEKVGYQVHREFEDENGTGQIMRRPGADRAITNI